eukprot:3699299-Alexandrium_andersonii.AAC.1
MEHTRQPADCCHKYELRAHATREAHAAANKLAMRSSGECMQQTGATSWHTWSAPEQFWHASNVATASACR